MVGLEFERFFSSRKSIMSIASKDAAVLRDTDSVQRALDMMVGGFRKLPVLRAGKIVGILGITDVLDYCGAGEKHRSFLKLKKPLQARVSSIMNSKLISIDSRSSLGDALKVFRDYKRGSYPVLQAGRVAGMVSDWDFLKGIRGRAGVKVRELMVERPAQAREHYPILDIARIMVRGGYRRLPVTRSGILTGIVLPTDLLLHLSRTGGAMALAKEKRAVALAMNRKVISVSPEQDVRSAASRMLYSGVGGLPVVEDHELVGIITESDIVQGLI